MDHLTADLLREAYAMGIFPMAEARDDFELHWIDPKRRGILPLDGFHIPRSLKKTLRRKSFEVTADQAFADVILSCAEATQDRPDTWINHTIAQLFIELYHQGFAHSIECWQEGHLVGGLYGLALGSAFFGESMFSRATDASKVALVYLVAALRANGFTLLDTQFITTHLSQFGAIEIDRLDYHKRLKRAIAQPASFAMVTLDIEKF